MLPIRALRLTRHDAVSLDRMAFEEGELVYDATNSLIRLMDGDNPGGKKLANQVWATNAISTAVTASNNTLTAAIALKAPINNPGFTGTVTGITATMVGLGNVTNESKATMFSGPTFTGTTTGTFSGNLTGNVTGAVTGNASTATQLATARNINGVAFNGSVNITLNTLVNGANTVSLGSTGITTFPGVINAGNINNLIVNDLGGGTSLTAGSQVQIGNSAGIAGAGVIIKNAVTNTLGGETSLESGSKIQMDNGNVSLFSYTYNGIGGGSGLDGRLGVEVDNSYLNHVVRIGTQVITTTGGSPTTVFQGVTFSQYGDISTPTGTVTASAVTTTNAITVGTNVNISTLPTQPQHASNKKYVDARSVAMSIALS